MIMMKALGKVNPVYLAPEVHIQVAAGANMILVVFTAIQ
jgi:hypothetical protein